jgi:translation elongation factor EF-1alpha
VTVRSLQYARTVTEERGVDAKSIACRSIAAVAVRGVDERVLRRLLRRGGVLGDARHPPTVAEELTANLIFFEPLTIYNDKEFQLLAYGSRVTCRVTDVEDCGKAGLLVFGPRYRGHPGEVVHARLALEAPFCIERARDLARMSRFVLRQNHRIVACGACVDLRVWRREDLSAAREVMHRSA